MSETVQRLVSPALTSMIMNSVRYGSGRAETVAAAGRLSLDVMLTETEIGI